DTLTFVAVGTGRRRGKRRRVVPLRDAFGEATGGAAHHIRPGAASEGSALLVRRAIVRERVNTEGNAGGQRVDAAQGPIPQGPVGGSQGITPSPADGNVIGASRDEAMGLVGAGRAVISLGVVGVHDEVVGSNHMVDR